VDDDDVMWTAAASLAALGAAALAKKVLTKSWTKRRGALPLDPLRGDGTWGEALAFAVVSGVTVGVVRLLAQRGVSLAYDKRKATAALADQG